MLAVLLIGAIIIYALVIAPAIRDARAASATWTTTRVIDGDTIEVQQGPQTERVRLAGIDTPERGQCGAQEATLRLTKLVAKDPQGRVVLSTTGEGNDDRDRYDRMIRYVTVDPTSTPTIDAGLALIQEGLAVARYDSRDGYDHHDRESQYVDADAISPSAVAC